MKKYEKIPKTLAFFGKVRYNKCCIKKKQEEWEQIPLFYRITISKEKTMTKLEQKVEALIKPTIEQLGYSLYDVIYEKEAQDYYLRIFIEYQDSKKSINLEDCEKVNDAISGMLDEADYIKDQYFLEVSSTGVEKHLRKESHFQENLEKQVEVSLFSPIVIEEGRKKEKQIEGILKGFDAENITIAITVHERQKEEKTLTIPRKHIAKMKLKYQWE